MTVPIAVRIPPRGIINAPKPSSRTPIMTCIILPIFLITGVNTYLNIPPSGMNTISITADTTSNNGCNTLSITSITGINALSTGVMMLLSIGTIVSIIVESICDKPSINPERIFLTVLMIGLRNLLIMLKILFNGLRPTEMILVSAGNTDDNVFLRALNPDSIMIAFSTI